MYLEFFGLNEQPFTITPDPRYLYLSAQHADALAHLLYGVSESGGFIQLTGEVGTGKTLLVRSLLEQLPPHVDVALVLNSQLSPREFLQAICDELNIRPVGGDGRKELVDCLNAYLLHAHAQGRKTVVIVDEAQNLDPEVLEQVRLLTNLETARQKLLQILLIGQPELQKLLASNELRQLAQRITGRFHLQPLTPTETQEYLAHRVRVAGGIRPLFSAAAAREMHRRSRGIPRLINVLADRALLAAYTRERDAIDTALIRDAAREVFGSRPQLSWLRAAGLTASAAASVLVLALLLRVPWLRLFAPSQATDLPETTLLASPAASDAIERIEPPAGPADVASLFAQPLDAGTDAAWTRLLGLWNGSYEPGAAPACDQARAQGLACLFQRGTLAHLLALDLPAIVTLTDAVGTRLQFVVAAARADALRLDTPQSSTWVSVASFGNYWFGEYLLLWRPQGGDFGTLVPGNRHPLVAWLRQALVSLTGEALPSADPQLFDATLAASVRSFQQSQRLEVDGIVGPRTRIAIQRALGEVNVPRLSAASP